MIHLIKGESNDDTGLFQRLVCLFFGKKQSLRSLNLYGISFNPPPGFFGVAFKANNYGDNVFVAADRPDLRFKGLEPGELKIGNYLTGDYVYWKADGTIKVKSSTQIDVEAPTINLKGNVVVTGTLEVGSTLEVGGTVTADNYLINGGASPDYLGHVHGGVDVGVNNTGGPV